MHETKNSQPDINIRYDQAAVTYAPQFLVSPGPEELLLELSSGLIMDPDDRQTLPIHTRLAMPWSAVERLAAVLNDVVARKRQNAQPAQAASPVTAAQMPQASLPSATCEPN